jgi:hypothetical protein
MELMAKESATYTAGEILEDFGERYLAILNDTIEKEHRKFKSPYYVLVLSAKEMWAPNLVRNWFVSRQTAPVGLDMVQLYPNHTKTLYEVRYSAGDVTLKWTLPGLPECQVIANSPYLYDPQLVRWIKECFEGTLEPL